MVVVVIVTGRFVYNSRDLTRGLGIEASRRHYSFGRARDKWLGEIK